MVITFIPHGQTQANITGHKSGWSDPPLSLQGARRLLKSNAFAGRRFDALFSSDLRRAAQTAQLLFPDQTCCLDERLRERNFGAYNGAHESLIPDDICEHTRTPGGESWFDVQKRVREFIDDAFASGLSEIAIVSHNYPQLALEVICKRCPWADAIASDWRTIGTWQSCWDYNYDP